MADRPRRYGPIHRCPDCGGPVDPLQAAEPDGGCPRDDCRREARARWLADEHDRHCHRRARGAARIREAGGEPRAQSWAPVPWNPARPVPLAPTAVREFRAHLLQVLRDRAVGGSGRASGSPTTDPAPPSEVDALARACAGCRGWCCRRGGHHAFLDAHSLERVRRDRPGAADAELIAVYLAHVGDTHLEGGCLFQGASGCRLPRNLRSDTCNDWLCPDLHRERRRWREGQADPGRTRFVPVSVDPDDKNS